MKKYWFITVVFCALTMISLGYALLAFVDTDLWIFTIKADPFKLIAGTGVGILCLRVVIRYINLIVYDDEDF